MRRTKQAALVTPFVVAIVAFAKWQGAPTPGGPQGPPRSHGANVPRPPHASPKLDGADPRLPTEPAGGHEALGPASAADPGATGSLHLLLDLNAAPVARRNILLRLPDGHVRHAISDDRGESRVENLPAGPVWVDVDGFEGAEASVDVVANRRNEHRVRLVRPVEVVTGTLVDDLGRAWAGKSIRGRPRRWTTYVEVESGEDGTFRLEGLPPGPLTLSGHGEGLTESVRDHVETQAPQLGVRLVVRRRALLRVRVALPAGAPPPDYARVEAIYAEHDGHVVVGGIEAHGDEFPLELPPGQPVVEVRAGGLVSQPRRVTLDPGEETSETFVLVHGFLIRGRVVTPAGRPVAKARVEIERNEPPYEVEADDEGRFVLDQLPERPLRLRLCAEGYARTPVVVAPTEEGTPLDLSLAHGAHLEGRVLDEQGRGLARRRVHIVRSDDANHRAPEDLVSDDAGRFACRIAPGAWTVYLSYGAREGIPVIEPTARIEIIEGQDREVTVRARR